MTEEIVKQEGEEGVSSDASCGDQNGGSCPQCSAREAEEHMAFAFLLALMPVITLTLFGQAGLL